MELQPHPRQGPKLLPARLLCVRPWGSRARGAGGREPTLPSTCCKVRHTEARSLREGQAKSRRNVLAGAGAWLLTGMKQTGGLHEGSGTWAQPKKMKGIWADGVGKGTPEGWNSWNKGLGVGKCAERWGRVTGFGWSTGQVGKQQWMQG